MARDGCCSTNCLKNILNFFNLLFLFASIGLLATTIWILNDHVYLINLLKSSTYSVLINVLLLAGSLLLLVSFLGCYAVLKENRRSLILVIFVLLFVVLLECMVTLVGFIYSENIKEDLKINLNDTMLENFGVDAEKTIAIDVLHQKFACCGAVQFEDWQYSAWRKTEDTKNLVPDSCCKSPSLGCGVRDHPSNIYYDGCLDKMEDQMKKGLMTLIIVGLCIAASQICGMILAIKLYLSLKEDIDINELRRILHNT